MKFAINAPNYGTFASPGLLIELAREAETAGWDGFFLWDHVQSPGPPLGDTWLLLAGMAASTQRIRIGPMVTPLPRRRPWKLAREAVTLDHLSGGRLILGLGLGDDLLNEYSGFAEPVSMKEHAEMLDEGLVILEALWRGEKFSFPGKHYRLSDVQFLPKPVQQPRIPIWLAGGWPARRPFRRAARWDGVAPVSREGPLTPQECREIAAFVQDERGSLTPFDVAVTSWYEDHTPEQEHEQAIAFEEAGATWYQVSLSDDMPPAEVRALVRAGPPRTSSAHG